MPLDFVSGRQAERGFRDGPAGCNLVGFYVPLLDTLTRSLG